MRPLKSSFAYQVDAIVCLGGTMTPLLMKFRVSQCLGVYVRGIDVPS